MKSLPMLVCLKLKKSIVLDTVNLFNSILKVGKSVTVRTESLLWQLKTAVIVYRWVQNSERRMFIQRVWKHKKKINSRKF